MNLLIKKNIINLYLYILKKKIKTVMAGDQNEGGTIIDVASGITHTWN